MSEGDGAHARVFRARGRRAGAAVTAASVAGRRGGRFAFAALLLANLVLGAGPFLVRNADVGPVAAAFWRLALAVPFLLLLVRTTRPAPARTGGSAAAAILLAGLFLAADLAVWHYGILRTRMANATLFGNASSFLFAIYGFVTARAMPRPLQVAALILAFVGATLLLGASAELSHDHLIGDLLSLLGGAFYALYLVVVDRLRRSMAAMPLLAWVTVAGAPPLLLVAAMLGERVVPGHWPPLLLLSIGSQVVGQGLLVYAMGHLKPFVVALGLLTQPILSALLGLWSYGESLSVADGIGAVLIAVALVMIRLPARTKRCASP